MSLSQYRIFIAPESFFVSWQTTRNVIRLHNYSDKYVLNTVHWWHVRFLFSKKVGSVSSEFITPQFHWCSIRYFRHIVFKICTLLFLLFLTYYLCCYYIVNKVYHITTFKLLIRKITLNKYCLLFHRESKADEIILIRQFWKKAGILFVFFIKPCIL